jgi:hypothetical protein
VPPGGQPRHPHRVLVGLGAAVGEEHVPQVAGRDLGDEPGRLAARVVAERGCDRAQLRRLSLDRRDHGRVLVAEVEVDQLRGEVQVAAALLVPEPAALAAGDDQRVERALGRPGVEDVRAVVLVCL